MRESNGMQLWIGPDFSRMRNKIAKQWRGNVISKSWRESGIVEGEQVEYKVVYILNIYIFA